MNNYREKYEKLTNNIKELKEQNEKLRNILGKKQTEYYNFQRENNVEKNKRTELLKRKRILVTNKDKKINRIYTFLSLIATIAVISSSFILGRALFLGANQLITRILAIYGAILLCTIIEFGVIVGLKDIINKIQKNFYRKNLNKPECIKLTKEIEEKSQIISKNDQKEKDLLKEIADQEDSISKLGELIILTENELLTLEREIIDAVVNDHTNEFQESKPFTRKRIR